MDEDRITPERVYEVLILVILVDKGGAAERAIVLETIKTKYGNVLSSKDREDYESGNGERWKNRVSFARQTLIDNGELKRNSRY